MYSPDEISRRYIAQQTGDRRMGSHNIKHKYDMIFFKWLFGVGFVLVMILVGISNA